MKSFCKLILLLVLCMGTLTSQAVLKERDLSHTLGVLRAELTEDYNRQQQFLAHYEQQSAAQHDMLVNYMTQCEEIGLMLYSQAQQNTFDIAYACEQASELYYQLKGNGRKRGMSYDDVVARQQREIERYERLVRTLKSIPPVLDGDSVLTQSDSILISAIDSLSTRIDSLALSPDSAVGKAPESLLLAAAPDNDAKEDSTATSEPLYLTGQLLDDRNACVNYAEVMLDGLKTFQSELQKEQVYYSSVQTKVEELHKFALERYSLLKSSIFVEGGDNYFTLLGSLSRNMRSAREDFSDKYVPFEGKSRTFSEWRGVYVLSISLFVVFYLALALIIANILLRWVLPKNWRGENFHQRRRMLTYVVGIAIFALFVMAVRSQTDRNVLKMGSEYIINIAWLMEVIFLSLFIRLKDEHMHHAVIIYTPLMILSFIVIIFRVVLIPDSIVNLFFPPLLLIFTVWQTLMARKHKESLPALDRFYTNITTLVMVLSTFISWAGYTLVAVQAMVWWAFQLAAIMTITLIHDLMEIYESKRLVYTISPALKDPKLSEDTRKKRVAALQKEMKSGHYFKHTWLFDFVRLTVVPVLAVMSLFFCLYWAGSTFEMTDIFIQAFFTNFVDIDGVIQLSLLNICIVAGLFFIFRFVNYSILSIYTHYRQSRLKQGEQMNLTLARNVIAILSWGSFFVITLILLHVPSSGISVVTAGLATGIGFAMKSILENFFYGLSLMTGRLRVGDYIECDGITGKVESISYQSTQVVTADGCVIAFLNSTLFSKNFKNMTRNHNYELIKIPVGVAYGSNVDEVRSVILKAIEPIRQEKNAAGHRIINPATTPSVAFSGFGDSSVDLVVCIWMLVESKIALTGRVKEIIYNTLNENNIEIPFPQRDVHMRND